MRKKEKATRAVRPEDKLRWSPYVKPYIWYFILGPFLMIVEVIGEVLMPRLQAWIINYGVSLHAEDPAVMQALIQGENIPSWVPRLYDLLGNNASAFVVTMAFGMVMTALLMMVGGVGGAWYGTRAAVNFAADLRRDVYHRVQKFSFANIDKFSTGSLVTRLTNDITQLQNFISTLLRMAMRAPGMLIGALIMAILLCPSLTWIIAVAVPILGIFIFVFIKIGSPRFVAMQTKMDGLNSTVQESITNVRVVKSFVREDFEDEKFATANGDLKRAGMSAMKMMIIMSPMMTLVMNSAVIAVLWFGGHMVTDGGMLVGDLSAFVTYITQILSSLMMVTMLFMQFARARASARRIREVMEEPIDIRDDEADSKDLTVTRGEVEFRHVTFRYYKQSQGKVLDDVSLKIPAGATVGIIGSTGAGKSTLVSLIPRLYDADEGEILVDGVNVRNYSLYHLREGVGMVLQKNVLFSGSIKDNLLWGDAEAGEESLRLAARQAQADGFVSGFKEGYETTLDQGGTNVSGGQKQRLCIARALLKKPRILILDDSTSAVDTATEARIREAFRGELRDATKIIIAQRITSVMEADMIVVINEGRITGVGTHDQLLAGNVEYKEIYESQMESAMAATVDGVKEVRAE